MEMNWVYLLIAVLYGVLVINKVLYAKLEKEVKQTAGEHFSKHMVLKEDFFTTVAMVCVIGALIINVLCLIGGNGLNFSSIIVTVLVVGLALMSGRLPMWGTPEGFEIGDYLLNNQVIKQVKTKKHGAYTRYQVVFEEEQNGYDRIGFYCANKYTGIMQEKLQKITSKDQ
ncbi:MAG: hypothetical protein ACRCW2_00695 [Cellulosilyticaceae bacterium]